MEKLVSVLWKPEATSDADFGAELRERAGALRDAGAMRLRINVVDEHVAPGARLRIGQMQPAKAAIANYWLHEADARGPVEAVLAEVASRVVSYLVVESEPLRNTAHVAPPGGRTEGFNLVTMIVPKAGLSDDAFRHLWHVEHRATAIETQSTFAYVRNEIVRAFDADAPDWTAIVEESFPIGALEDPKVFYDADSDAELKKRTTRMFESVSAFLALDRVESHPMSEYVFER